MSNDTKVIPIDIWKKFLEYWDSIEYEKLKADEIKKIFGKHLYVALPKNITDVKQMDEWYDKMKALKEKAQPFGGYSMSFKGDKTTLGELFGDEEINPAQMTKRIWDYVKSKKGEK